MNRCYICDRTFSKTVTKYPDGKDPCPECVESYRRFHQGSDEVVPLDEDSERMEQLEMFSFPAEVEDYYS